MQRESYEWRRLGALQMGQAALKWGVRWATAERVRPGPGPPRGRAVAGPGASSGLARAIGGSSPAGLAERRRIAEPRPAPLRFRHAADMCCAPPAASAPRPSNRRFCSRPCGRLRRRRDQPRLHGLHPAHRLSESGLAVRISKRTRRTIPTRAARAH